MLNENFIKLPFGAKRAVDKLDSNAFYLLNVIYYLADEGNDEAIRKLVGYGTSKYRQSKRILVEKGFLHVEQIGKSTYKYTVGGLYE